MVKRLSSFTAVDVFDGFSVEKFEAEGQLLEFKERIQWSGVQAHSAAQRISAH